MRRVRVTIHGRVQGVGFRDALRRRAAAADVAGWVHNRRDGAVEAVLEGEAEPLESLVGFCETGPRGASVERVESADEKPEGVRGFEVR